jgi:hypothetical protein
VRKIEIPTASPSIRNPVKPSSLASA